MTRIRILVLLSLLASLLVAGTSAATSSSPGASSFGELFPKLPAFEEPTNQQIADLAQGMLDPNAADGDNAATPSFFTYFGQFIDHDLTKDTLPQPTAFVDPATLLNSRTFRFDLDSVYCGGPGVTPEVYAADGVHFLVQDPNPNGVLDLPRRTDGSAILCEGRNDENQIISQVHLAFLKFHNRQVDAGLTFEQARQRTVAVYQSLVLHQALPHFVGQAETNAALAEKQPVYRVDNPNRPTTPVEFSVAAYRFGHSIIRKAYITREGGPKIQVFNPPGDDLHGGRQLSADHSIQWGTFVPELNTNPATQNVARRIDPLISSGLFNIPIPGAEATGSNVLAFRNMTRAAFYGMPSGQDVARAMGETPISPAQVTTMPGFSTGSPLWFYILREAELTTGGATLGPVGGRLVADTFVQVMRADPTSLLRNPPVADPQETPARFLTDAGVADRP